MTIRAVSWLIIGTKSNTPLRRKGELKMMTYLLVVSVLVQFAAAFIAAGKTSKENQVVLLGIIVMATCTIGVIAFGAEASKDRVYKELTKEVNLQQVAATGQNSFLFQGRAIYKEGKLESVMLVPKTTATETTTTK